MNRAQRRAAQSKVRFLERRRKRFKAFCGPSGATTFTMTVIDQPDLQAAYYHAACGNRQAAGIASLVTRWMTEAVVGAEPEQNAQCLVCTTDFGALEVPAAVCLVNNFKETPSMMSGVCEKCFAQAQVADDPLEYLAKYYRDLAGHLSGQENPYRIGIFTSTSHSRNAASRRGTSPSATIG
jgi:hypothetical protein